MPVSMHAGCSCRTSCLHCKKPGACFRSPAALCQQGWDQPSHNALVRSAAKSKLVSTRKALDTRRAAVEGRVDALARTRAASTYILPQDLRTHELALLHAR